MNNTMEIQREQDVEIVGTQYDGRATNHKNLIFHQKLIMKHQSDNIHDPNAVVILTDDGKELGYMPKGHASIYAPAIDSGRYNFTVEIIKTEYDSERPILIVKVISELNNCSEEEVERKILKFVQNIVNECAERKTEYLKFIYSETVNTDELLASLNGVRLIQKLYSLSSDIITNNNIKQTTTEYFSYTKEALFKIIDELQADINDVIKELQKTWNEYIDIDIDDDKTLNEIRKRRKKFRSYEELFTHYHESVEKYVFINIDSDSDVKTKTEIVQDNSEPVIKNEVTDKSSNLTEKAFFDWLVSDGGVSKTTANVYISNIHGVEKLYQNIYDVRKNLLGAVSADDVKEMIEALVQRNEYNNTYNAALGKFAQFAGISVDKLKIQPVKKNYQPPVKSGTFVIKTVDFESPDNCTYYKPCSFILNESKYLVKSWQELYTKFLNLLYNDNTYTEIMKGMIGKSLYGHRSDFEKHSYHLRKSIRVSANFYAEGNLSAVDIIKHIKCLMNLCSIDNDHMIIEYNTHEKSDEDVVDDENGDNTSEDNVQFSMSEQTATDEESTASVTTLVSISFKPDTAKPFVLKDAMIEILSSDAPEITNCRNHKNGIYPEVLRKLIKEYYGKTIGLFEISNLLMADKTFKYVGTRCYVLNTEMFPQEKDEILPQEEINTSPVSSFTDLQSESIQVTIDNNITIETILDIIKKNSDNLQYEDGFGAYEIKTLLANQGITDISEETIETLMTECSELNEIEDGYYVLADAENNSILPELECNAITGEQANDTIETITKDMTTQETVSDTRHITLKLNGNTIETYDYSDALNKICEFAINYKPFRMARIAGQGICIKGSNVFYRSAVPVDNCNKLSNGLQIIAIDTLTDLQTITDEVKKYCQIDDGMIAIIS